MPLTYSKEIPANFMHFHAGAATQQTQWSSVSPLQILLFCMKITQPTALLPQPLQGHCHLLKEL